ncbi:hypothetical protein FBEOM_13986 [Fusarium beomiforme]|uniref:Uncharacterized protein n=1 Tax=Fusarium beomiforme TaxID=44412 RepID=A0A9P5A4P0_9HYPO|nr:hypothetical protein FBEOM_13986 [Fusarium beomiforme]
MNISAGSSIKNGGIVGSGSSVTLDEGKFTESDLNAVVSVKVINQTTDLVGDVTIKGFVNSANGQSEFVLNENGSNKGTSAAMSKTETTITVSWSGGGQIKPENQSWTLDSLYSAAAAFPANVARCPQKTWAILTPYYHSKSFLKWSKDKKIKVPQFDGALVYANALLDMFMEYKTLVGRIQAVLNNPVNYICTKADNPIRVNVIELLEVRKELNKEMKKITKMVDKISQNPESVDEIESQSDIQEPELWTTRIPIHRPNEENSDEWSTAKAAEVLSNFSFSVDSPVQKTGTTSQSDPADDVAFPPIHRLGQEISFMEEEKKEFSTIQGRKKFRDFWIGMPVGYPDGVFFNDARKMLDEHAQLTQADTPLATLLHGKYPAFFEIYMVFKYQLNVIGWIRTPWGVYGDDSKRSVEKIALYLEPDERVVNVRIGKAKEMEIYENSVPFLDENVGIAFIELMTNKGRRMAVGDPEETKVVQNMPKDPSQGLRGCASPQCSFDLIGWLREYLPPDKLTDARADGDEMDGVKKPSARKPTPSLAPSYEKKTKQWANDFMAPYKTPPASRDTITLSHLSEYMKTYVCMLEAKQLFEIISKNPIEMIPEFGIVDLRDTYDRKKIKAAIDMPFEDKPQVAVLKQSTDPEADERVWNHLPLSKGHLFIPLQRSG